MNNFNTILLEEEGVIPRYGRELEDRIILPEEIYDKKKTDALFESAQKSLQSLCTFLENFQVEELKEILEDVKTKIEKFTENK